ncbi:MAG: DUF2092 domain-containing protein [Pseudomonadota bacterium]
MIFGKHACAFACALATMLALAMPSNVTAQESQAESAPAEETFDPIDPVALELLQGSMEYVSSLQNFSFDWFISSDKVVEGREKITYVNSGTTIMARGRGFTSRTERGLTLRDFYFDGKTFVVASPDQGFYASAPFDGSFEELVDRARADTDLELPVWTMLTDDLPERLTTGVTAAAYLDTTKIVGREVHHVSFVGDVYDWQVWISADPERPVPLMLVGTRTDQQGWPQFRVNMMDWQTGLEIAEEDISFTPEEGMMRIAMPSFAREAEEGPSSDSEAGAGS